MQEITRSYADSNLELVESFERYMIARNLSPHTITSYRFTIERFMESLGPVSAVQAGRADIHNFQAKLISKGQGAASLNARTNALRLFYKFLSRAGLVTQNPLAYIGCRKVPKRLPRVLTIEEVEKLIAAARDPLERAVVEVFYATGMRLHELAALRLENIDFAGQTVKIVNGKGGKDRYTLFGRHAAKAIEEYIAWRKPRTFLFEAPPRSGEILRRKRVCEAEHISTAYSRNFVSAQSAICPPSKRRALPSRESPHRFPAFVLSAGVPTTPARYTESSIVCPSAPVSGGSPAHGKTRGGYAPARKRSGYPVRTGVPRPPTNFHYADLHQPYSQQIAGRLRKVPPACTKQSFGRIVKRWTASKS